MLKREVQLGVTDALHRAQHPEELPALGRLHNPPSGVTVSVGRWGTGDKGQRHFMSPDFPQLREAACMSISSALTTITSFFMCALKTTRSQTCGHFWVGDGSPLPWLLCLGPLGGVGHSLI